MSVLIGELRALLRLDVQGAEKTLRTLEMLRAAGRSADERLKSGIALPTHINKHAAGLREEITRVDRLSEAYVRVSRQMLATGASQSSLEKLSIRYANAVGLAGSNLTALKVAMAKVAPAASNSGISKAADDARRLSEALNKLSASKSTNSGFKKLTIDSGAAAEIDKITRSFEKLERRALQAQQRAFGTGGTAQAREAARSIETQLRGAMQAAASVASSSLSGMGAQLVKGMSAAAVSAGSTIKSVALETRNQLSANARLERQLARETERVRIQSSDKVRRQEMADAERARIQKAIIAANGMDAETNAARSYSQAKRDLLRSETLEAATQARIRLARLEATHQRAIEMAKQQLRVEREKAQSIIDAENRIQAARARTVERKEYTRQQAEEHKRVAAVIKHSADMKVVDAEASKKAAQAQLVDAQAAEILANARKKHAQAAMHDVQAKRLHEKALRANAQSHTVDTAATNTASAAYDKHAAAVNRSAAASRSAASAQRAAASSAAGIGSLLGMGGGGNNNIADMLYNIGAMSTLAYGPLGNLLSRLSAVGVMVGSVSVRTMVMVGAISAGVSAFARFGSEAVRVARNLGPVEELLNLTRPITERAGESFEDLTRIALRYGIAIENMARPYARLKIAAEGTAAGGRRFKEMFEDIAIVAARFSLPQDQIVGLTKALEQMISKGTVQAEEFRQQLGDRLPAAARVGLQTFRQVTGNMNATMAQFLKAMEKRQIISDTFVPQMMSNFREMFGLTKEVPQNINAAFGRLSTSWDLFIRGLDKATGYTRTYIGLLNMLSGGLEGLSGNVEFLATTLQAVAAAGAFGGALVLARNYTAAAKAAALFGTALIPINRNLQSAKLAIAGVLAAAGAFITLPNWVIGAGAAVSGLVYGLLRLRGVIAAGGGAVATFSGAWSGIVGVLGGALTAFRNLHPAIKAISLLFAAGFTTSWLGKLQGDLDNALLTVERNRQRIAANAGKPIEIQFEFSDDSARSADRFLQEFRIFMERAADAAHLKWDNNLKSFTQKTKEELKRIGADAAFALTPNINVVEALDKQISSSRAELQSIAARIVDSGSITKEVRKGYGDALRAVMKDVKDGKMQVELPVKPLTPKDIDKLLGNSTRLRSQIQGLEDLKRKYQELQQVQRELNLSPSFEVMKTQLTAFESVMISIRPVFQTFGPLLQAIGAGLGLISVAAAAGIAPITGWLTALGTAGGILGLLARRLPVVAIGITALGVAMGAFSDPVKAATEDVRGLIREADRLADIGRARGSVPLDPAQQAAAAIEAQIQKIRVAIATINRDTESQVKGFMDTWGRNVTEATRASIDKSVESIRATGARKVEELAGSLNELQSRLEGLRAQINVEIQKEAEARAAMERQAQAARTLEEAQRQVALLEEKLNTLRTAGYEAAEAQYSMNLAVAQFKALTADASQIEAYAAAMKRVAELQQLINAESRKAASDATGGGAKRVGVGGGGGALGMTKEQAAEIIARSEAIIAGKQQEYEEYKRTSQAVEEYRKALELMGVTQDQLPAKLEALRKGMKEVGDEIDMSIKKIKPIKVLQNDLFSFADTFAELLTSGELTAKSLGDAFKKMALSISKDIVAMVIKINIMLPLLKALQGAMGGGGAFSFAGSGFDFSAPAFAFAKGGIVDRPTYFSTPNMGLGVMGEAGAEAILPLARGPGGKLGVMANGGGGGSSVTNITFNVSSPNADSFKRSEGQIASMLSRTVSRGGRNM